MRTHFTQIKVISKKISSALVYNIFNFDVVCICEYFLSEIFYKLVKYLNHKLLKLNNYIYIYLFIY